MGIFAFACCLALCSQTVLSTVDNSTYLTNYHGDNVVADQYIMRLAEGYTLAQQRQKVGDALQDSNIRVVFNRISLEEKIWYSAELDTESLAIITSDKSVELIECNLRRYA